MASTPASSSLTLRVPDDLEALNAYFHAQGMTDGLPIMPPTPEAVRRMLAYTDRDPQEVIGILPPRKGQATVEKIAINAVMAGCLPQYLPVVIAAIEALADESFNLYGILATTHPCSTLVLVNGPIAQELGINAGYNALGQGWRSNASIGRAVRLVTTNIAGALPGVLDRATLGTPAKYTYCFAEHELASPWEPLHVERGYAPETSTVTVVGGEAPHNINDHGSTSALGLLGTVAGTIAIVGSNHAAGVGEPLIVFGPEHAATIAADGFNKAQIKTWLFEHATVAAGRFSPENIERFSKRYPEHWSNHTPETLIPIAAAAEDINIVVAGGAGKHSCFIPTFGHTHAVTRALTLRDGTAATSVEAFRRS